jgi:triphosphoribosyl-dephospho-CoA synthase
LLSVGTCAAAACLLEVTARKPGNVHRFRDFPDATYLDFALSAVAIGPCLEHAAQRGVGATVLEIVQRTREVVATNTNLGIALLLSPLAAVPRSKTLSEGIGAVLGRLTLADSIAVFEAIRLAKPGGLGEVADQDAAGPPTKPLREVMALAAERDLVARQHANGYQEVFRTGVPALLHGWQSGWPLERTIIDCHLRFMSNFPDSLIARKRGTEEALTAATLAARALEVIENTRSNGKAIKALDQWLTEIGHERNPGTTADLVTASLFAALRDGLITLPLDRPWAMP